MDLVATDWQERLPPYGLASRLAWETGIRNGTASPISEQDYRQAREGMRWSWKEMDCVREAEVPA